MTNKLTILYIEDDPASARLLDRLLTHAGYAVILAEDGLKGIDRARETRPDLILTDINLPDISGYEIATTLRNDDRFRQTPIVALTADPAYDSNRDMATAAGITGYLTKPIDVSEPFSSDSRKEKPKEPTSEEEKNQNCKRTRC